MLERLPRDAIFNHQQTLLFFATLMSHNSVTTERKKFSLRNHFGRSQIAFYVEGLAENNRCILLAFENPGFLVWAGKTLTSCHGKNSKLKGRLWFVMDMGLLPLSFVC